MRIMHNDLRYRENIETYLIQRAHAVQVDTKGNLMNMAVLSEDFYAEFLNILLDLSLTNANVLEPNKKAIDLIDLENRVVVQVSTTCAPYRIRTKIKDSIKNFDPPEQGEWQFYFVPITEKAPGIRADFAMPVGVHFDHRRDILDIARIMELARGIKKLKALSELVDQYSRDEQTERDEQLPKYLTNTAFISEKRIIHRSSIIDNVAQLLSTTDRHGNIAKCNILLFGFGGCGKTSIARVVYWKMLSEVSNGAYRSIGWIDYNINLKHSILYSSAIKLCQYENDEEKRWNAIKQILLSSNSVEDKVLLFIDNVDQNASVEQWPQSDSDLQLFADSPSINLVLTSRLSAPIRSDSIHPIEIPLLNENECIDLFYFYWKGNQRENKHDITLIKQLIKRSHNHTYAIKLLASGARFINLEYYVRQISDINFQFSFFTDNREEFAANELRRLFEIKTRTAEQLRVLYDFSALPQTSLELHEVSFLLGYSRKELQPLIDEAWLTFQGGFTIHPLIKEVLRMYYMDGKAPLETMRHLLSLVAANQLIGKDDSFSDITRKIGIVEHVEKQVIIPSTIAVEFYYYLGMIEYNYARKRLSSIDYLTKALHFNDQTAHDDLNKTAMIRYQLGYIKSTTREYRSCAKDDLNEALTIWESLGGHEEELDMVYDHLGYVLTDSPETYQMALHYLNLALISRKKRFDTNKTRKTTGDYATTCDNLGYLLMKSSPPSDETYSLLKKSYDLRNEIYQSFGDNITEVAWTAYNIGVYLSHNGLSFSDAEKYLKHALTLRRIQNKEHPNVYTSNIVLTLVELSKLLSENKSRYAEAIKLLDEAEGLGREIDAEHTGFFYDDIIEDIMAIRKRLDNHQ